jgi:hypothetical protein
LNVYLIEFRRVLFKLSKDFVNTFGDYVIDRAWLLNESILKRALFNRSSKFLFDRGFDNLSSLWFLCAPNKAQWEQIL